MCQKFVIKMIFVEFKKQDFAYQEEFSKRLK